MALGLRPSETLLEEDSKWPANGASVRWHVLLIDRADTNWKQHLKFFASSGFAQTVFAWQGPLVTSMELFDDSGNPDPIKAVRTATGSSPAMSASRNATGG